MPNRNPRQADTQKQPPLPGSHGNDVGKDTDGDGRVVQPGHVAGDVDGDRQRKAQSGSFVGKDTAGDGRVVQPGRKPGEIDGDRQNQKH
jgi:hypothetical protein